MDFELFASQRVFPEPITVAVDDIRYNLTHDGYCSSDNDPGWWVNRKYGPFEDLEEVKDFLQSRWDQKFSSSPVLTVTSEMEGLEADPVEKFLRDMKYPRNLIISAKVNKI